MAEEIKTVKPSISDILKGFLSRKFLCALIAGVIAFGNAMWNWGLTNDQVLTIVAPLLAYIGIEGWADIKSR